MTIRFPIVGRIFGASVALIISAFLAATPPASATETQLVRDIVSGRGASAPLSLTSVGGTLFFTAKTPAHGRELWRSDGTPVGTELVRDIRSGIKSSNSSHLTRVRGTLFFAARDGIRGEELWRSDGTRAGTKLIRDIRRGSHSSHPSQLRNVGGRLFFTAAGIRDRALWRSNGTRAGTRLLREIEGGRWTQFRQPAFAESSSSRPIRGATAMSSGGLMARGRERGLCTTSGPAR